MTRNDSDHLFRLPKVITCETNEPHTGPRLDDVADRFMAEGRTGDAWGM